jgi:hypothetical protein
MKGVSLPVREILAEKIGEVELLIEQNYRSMRQVNLRRMRTSNLPIRGISREWTKTLLSVASVALW